MRLYIAFWVAAAFVTLAAMTYYLAPVHAAPSEPVALCQPVAIGGGITVYYCEPDYGQPFYLNSFGFMMREE